MAKMSVGIARSAFLIEAIYSNDSALHIKWKAFLATRYTWLCEAAWEHYLKDETGGKEAL